MQEDGSIVFLFLQIKGYSIGRKNKIYYLIIWI